MSKPLDIIIPVYNAYEYLAQCLESVFANMEPDCGVILVDDGSTDLRISQLFLDLEKRALPYLRLFKNQTNQGFVKTANRGMALSERDIILLNSDTIVTQRWLTKMRRCADSNPRIGTITPFSNNAEICSFPEICQDNDLYDAEAVNFALEQAALPLYPDLPTAVGFCMFIRRTLIKKIGFFDEATFGLGYGEENDFCMRAAKAGFRNVLCDDTFIAHVGNRSFASDKQALCEENMGKLLAKHPKYMKDVTAFIGRDPIAPIREMAKSFMNLSGEQMRPGILHVLHGRKGGTENHIRGLIAAERESARHYLLITMGGNWELEDNSGTTVVRYHFEHYTDELWADFLGGICSTFRINLCHIHHLSGCRDGLLEAFSGLNIPYGFTVHDFYLACPTINLLNPSGTFCGAETEAGHCQACLSQQPMFENISIEKWRTTHRKFLQNAQFLIAPSVWVAETFQRYFPDTNLRIIPHGVVAHHGAAEACSAFLLPQDHFYHVGVLGAIGPVKGARRLESLVARTKARNLPLRWIVIGYLDRQFLPHQDKDKILTIHGQYDEKNVQALLDHYRIGLVIFPSAGPEAFSYTLSEAWAAGRAVLVPPIGALGERVSKAGAGWLMREWQNEDSILDQVMDILHSENEPEFQACVEAAKAVSHSGVSDMARVTLGVYDTVGPQAQLVAKPMAKNRLFDAAKNAIEGRRVTQARKNFKSVTTSFLHLALRFRYTRPGRWLYLNLPMRWQQALKQRLLQS